MIKKVVIFFLLSFFAFFETFGYANLATSTMKVVCPRLAKVVIRKIPTVVPSTVVHYGGKTIVKDVGKSLIRNSFRTLETINPVTMFQRSDIIVSTAAYAVGRKPMLLEPLSKTALRKYPVIKSLNSELYGKIIPGTGVKMRRFLVDTPSGKAWMYHPSFPNKSVVKLPVDMFEKANTTQFRYCTKQLSLQLEKNPALRKQFSKDALRAIEQGEAHIPGYVWNHSPKTGVLELVDENLHSLIRHIGGSRIWGPNGKMDYYKQLKALGKEVSNVL